MPEEGVVLRKLPGRLLAWYGKAKRDLPWRRTRDPYRIWLAEVMLQQTRVETVTPYYERFLGRFPTLRALARAPLDAVLKLWAGLGYYARARSFHAAARQIVERHGGRIPGRAEDLLALPGVGRYTAGAVLSIAYGLPTPILDGNVERVLCRLFAIAENPKATPTRKRLWALAESLVCSCGGRIGGHSAFPGAGIEQRRGQTARLSPKAPRGKAQGKAECPLPHARAGDFNQAMMELGATVCTPNAPACNACPVADLCEAFRLGQQRELPRMPRKKAVPHFDVAVGLVWRRGKLLIAKRPVTAMLGGLWEFPGGKREPGEPLEETVRREVLEETGLRVEVGPLLATVNHAYSHFRVTLHAFPCASARGKPRPLGCDACRWVAPTQLSEYAFPAATARIIRSLAQAALRQPASSRRSGGKAPATGEARRRSRRPSGRPARRRKGRGSSRPA